LIVIEETETGLWAYSPDLDGCIATGETQNAVETAMRETISFHLEGLQHEGYRIPEAHGYSTYGDVAV